LLSKQFNQWTRELNMDSAFMKLEVIVVMLIANLIYEFNDNIALTNLIRIESGLVHIRVKANTEKSKSMGYLIGFIEELKSRFSIKEYTINAANLEQIFIEYNQEDNIGKFNKKLLDARSVSIQM
jgi:hypothetical protein